MALLSDTRPTARETRPARVRLEPVRLGHTMLDGRWWPRTDDPCTEMPGLVAALDAGCGPVVRLLLSAAGWVRRPHHVVVADRVVSLGYFSDQPAALLTALCADGDTVSLLVAPPTTEADVPAGADQTVEC